MSFFLGKRAQLSLGWQWSASPDAHQKVGAGEQYIKPMGIFGQSLINCFAVSKESFHYQKGMLDFGANRRFTPFNLLFPVQSAWGFLNAAHAAIYAIVDGRQVLVASYLFAFCNAEVARVAINNGIVFADKL